MINKLAKLYFDYKFKQVDKFIENPILSQQKIFSHLISSGKETLFGRENNFAKASNIDDYRKLVPLQTYENLRPYLDKIIKDKQQNILWNKPITWFAMSSGTTEDRSKYIPVSRESLTQGHYRCGEQMLAIYAKEFKDVNFIFGKTLLLGGSQQVNNIGESVFTGDISAILIKNVYTWTKRSKTPESISLIVDWEEKLEKLTKYATQNDIRALMGVPSWMLILLKKIKEETGKDICDIWPNLEVFFHGGVSFSPFQSQYDKLITRPQMRYWETYNASEGFFGVQLHNNSKDMLLMLDSGIYYEFIPMTDFYKDKPDVYTLSEVKVGINYAIVISTNGGLWRYIIGDTIEFTSTQPFLFKITGRTKSFINAFGEELIVDNADSALSIACKKNDAIISEYTAAPIYFGDNNTGAHEWIIEFSKNPQDIQQFTKDLDEALKSVNSDYAAKRSYNLSLRQPVIHFLAEGSFNKWLQSINKTGGQNKIPRLSNNRDYIERLKTFLQID